jgi:hypothetical protein
MECSKAQCNASIVSRIRKIFFAVRQMIPKCDEIGFERAQRISLFVENNKKS